MCSVWALSKQHSGIKCWPWHCFPPQAVNSSEITTWSHLSVAEEKDHLPSLLHVAGSMGLSDLRAETHLHRTVPKIPFSQWEKRELPTPDPAMHARFQVVGQVVARAPASCCLYNWLPWLLSWDEQSWKNKKGKKTPCQSNPHLGRRGG